MAQNVPAGTEGQVSFGPGIVYLGAEGATPAADIGYVKGNAVLSTTRTPLPVEQGSPKTLKFQYVIREEVSLKVTGIEWNLDALVYALGAGNTSVSGATTTFKFGGATTVSNRAVRFLHIAADGSTIDLHIFKAQGSGTIEITMPDEDLHEINYEFLATEATSDFENAAVAAGEKLYQIVRTAA